MDQWVFNSIFLLYVVFTAIIRIPHQRRNKSNKITNSQISVLEKVLLFAVWLGMMVLPMLYIFSPWISFVDFEIPIWMQWIGVAIIACALWLFYRSHKDLGQNWSASLEIREEHNLVTNGIYRQIRHPMYACIWLMVIGQALLLPNYIAGYSGLLTFGLLYFLRIEQEEKMMLDEFGSAYQAYMKDTKRLIPRF